MPVRVKVAQDPASAQTLHEVMCRCKQALVSICFSNKKPKKNKNRENTTSAKEKKWLRQYEGEVYFKAVFHRK
jgi:hypothetical protein